MEDQLVPDSSGNSQKSFPKTAVIAAVVVGLLAVGAIAYVAYLKIGYESRQNVASKPSSAAPPPQNSITATGLTITHLDTRYEKGGLVPQYPISITVPIPLQFSDQLEGYGVIELVLVGPQGWTGNGRIGADGQGVASLYPVGGSADVGAHIVVLTSPSCVSCVYHLAAPYFSQARQWVDQNEKVTIAEKEGLAGDVVTSRLLRYSLPSTPDGMEVNGAAYFHENISGQTPAQPYFISMEVTLPSSQHDLAIVLLDLFVQRRKLE